MRRYRKLEYVMRHLNVLVSCLCLNEMREERESGCVCVREREKKLVLEKERERISVRERKREN